jgi:hypothetical protein
MEIGGHAPASREPEEVQRLASTVAEVGPTGVAGQERAQGAKRNMGAGRHLRARARTARAGEPRAWEP